MIYIYIYKTSTNRLREDIDMSALGLDTSNMNLCLLDCVVNGVIIGVNVSC